MKPFFVVSKLSKFKSSSVLVPSPTTFVKNALSLVGVEHSTTGYWAHELQVCVGVGVWGVVWVCVCVWVCVGVGVGQCGSGWFLCAVCVMRWVVECIVSL